MSKLQREVLAFLVVWTGVAVLFGMALGRSAVCG